MSASASWRDALACSGTRLAIGAVAVALILFVHWAVGLLAVPVLYGIEHLVRRRLARPASCARPGAAAEHRELAQ